MRRNAIIVTIAVLAIAVFTLMFAGCAKQKEVIKLGAILAVTGPAASLGGPEARTLEMLVADTNKAGGILRRQVQLIVKDSQGSAEKAVSFAKQLVEEDEVLAIIGPSTSGESMSLKGYCEENETILVSCAAAETIVNPVAKWVFKTPQNDAFAVIKIYQTMQALGITKIGVVVSSSGFGQGGKAQLGKYAAEYGMTIVISETYDAASTDLTGVLSKLKAKDIQAVVNWSVEPAQSLVAKNMRQVGMEQPLFQSHGFGNISYVTAAGKAAEGIIFPCGRLFYAEQLPDSHAQKKVLTSYKRAYEEKYGENASTFGGHAYDAFLVVVEALKKARTVDKFKVRDAIEGIKGLAGTAGVFTFSPADHNGLSLEAFEMFTVKNGEFVLYTGK
jgi:branched-chain amino acid transport system substrate-binding protein